MNSERDTLLNTERDNFYDWAKDKPDTTNFARLNSAYGAVPVRAPSTMPWSRIGMLLVVGAVVVGFLKLYVL